MWGSLFHICSLSLSHMSPYAYCFTVCNRKMCHAHWHCGSYDMCVAAAPECHLSACLLLYFSRTSKSTTCFSWNERRTRWQMMVDMCVTVPLFFLFGCLLGFSVVVQLFYIYVNFQVTSFRLRGQYFSSPIEITPTGDFRLTVQQKIPLPRWVFYLFWRVLDQLPVPKMDTYHRLC